ncbi:MAG: YidC/Oxa1 family insertase periplasmic-domain containing protein [Planctomycetaceae bacterium]|nr:YidC/Oxa1 family insertase periplasmic-domain containing protein [Planctomycetales bacterium]MCB9923853.1 YidC/Oxa1 family insertase periplasmic-domain containing protein [Planctomycetaceae bacterium]
MEKRFVLFLGLSLGILVGYSMLARMFFPTPPVAEQEGEVPASDETAAALDGEPASLGEHASEPIADPSPEEPVADSEVRDVETPVLIEQRWETLGSYAADSEHSLLVTFNNRGAAIERVELTTRDAKGKLKYRNLEDKSGYFGYLALTPRAELGCKVNVVGHGTPAELSGLQRDDILLAVDGMPIDEPSALTQVLAGKKPGDSISLQVHRPGSNSSGKLELTAKLDVRPLELIRPDPLQKDELVPHPLSFLLSLTEKSGVRTVSIDSPSKRNWEVEKIEDGVLEFRVMVDESTESGEPIQLVKRFRLGKAEDLASVEESAAPNPPLAYHVDMELELSNAADAPRRLAYSLGGPTGLPMEGWWYSAKIHPKMFYGAGARDVLIRTKAERRLVGCPELYKIAKKEPTDKEITLFADDEKVPSRTLDYLGVDTQYFTAALIPTGQEGTGYDVFDRAEAYAIGDVSKQPKGYSRTTDVTFRLDSAPISLEGNASYKQSFRIFLGPKDPDVLEPYGLGDVIYYGWFGAISKVLKTILHFFYSVVGNFGVAIILLTVVVRGCMFPISRKAAKNAAMMQELAPEMRKLTEKYKGDMEKRAKAQQELFRKHNYNPFGGCWLMFLQLPIFLGLYRCIAVDIELRQAALIPGIEWCSNLAGPDQFLYWKSFMPNFFVAETGMLGPYLNILPLITVSLFLVHQKLFTPPATDEQSAMQLKMMKYMTLFMGFLFFKVASGLCLYFIASSLWGIAERKLVPKPKVSLSAGSGGGNPPPKKIPPSGSNGVEEKKAARKRRNKTR